MDALVLWQDGTQTKTPSSDIIVEECKCIKVGSNVKKIGEKNWVKGIVLTLNNPCEPEITITETPGVNILQNLFKTPPKKNKKDGTQSKQKINTQQLAKALRNTGQAYVSRSTKKLVPPRVMKDRCNDEVCRRTKKDCFKITEEERQKIFEHFYALGNLQKQREFLVRHMEIRNTKIKTTKSEVSRRQHTIKYSLTVGKRLFVVCKKLFLNTLAVSEKSCRTSLQKVNDFGILEEEKRGGRQVSEAIRLKEELLRQEIDKHIETFNRVETHFCGATTKKKFLQPDLSCKKMYDFFCQEKLKEGEEKVPSLSSYRRIFQSKKLEVYKPKKDHCAKCAKHKEEMEQMKKDLKKEKEVLIQESSYSSEQVQQIQAHMNAPLAYYNPPSATTSSYVPVISDYYQPNNEHFFDNHMHF